MKFLLVRHCKATGQEPEAELTEDGVRQAQELSMVLKQHPVKVTRILTSPFTRAKQSIEPFSQSENLEIEVDERLRERKLSDKPLDDWLEILEQSFIELDQKVHDGESSNEAMNRATSLLHDLMEEFEEGDESFLLMTHGNLLALILKYFDNRYGFEEWKNLTNPDLYLVEKRDMGWEVKRFYEG